MEKNLSADLLERLLFALMKDGAEDLSAVKSRFAVILNDYRISPKETALVVWTEGKNERYIQKFLLAKAVAGCSPNTITAYGSELRRVFNELGKDADTVTSDDIQILLALKLRDGVSKSYANTLRLYLSTFYAYLMREELIARNPMLKIEKIKFHKKDEGAFSEIEVERIRDGCRNARERAIVELLLSTGCRLSELASIRIDDIQDGAATILGKGQKYRNVYLNAKATVAVENYLKERRDANPYLFPASVMTRGEVFAGKDEISVKFRRLGEEWYKDASLVSPDRPAWKDVIGQIVSRLGRRVKVENCHPHRFRRTCATFALRRGMPVEQVSKMLGHASIATTQIYLDLREDELAQAHRKYVY